jgi:hypothetical protein
MMPFLYKNRLVFVYKAVLEIRIKIKVIYGGEQPTDGQ